MKFGIIGFGRFGKLWANSLLPYGKVLVYDKTAFLHDVNSKIKLSTLAEVTKVDMLFLLVPISEFENCCDEIKDLITPHTIIVDCCSVKVYSVNIMKKIFSENQPLIATHPLFGPDSVKKTGGLTGHKIVLCPIQSDEDYIKDLFARMGLKIIISTPDEHDKQMATSQCLVHFIGRGLVALNLHQQELSTPDFQALININHMVVHDRLQLFLDMQRYNPYSKEVRDKLIKQLLKLDSEIDGGH